MSTGSGGARGQTTHHRAFAPSAVARRGRIAQVGGDGGVREWVRTKRLTAYRVGRDYRVKRADLDKFLEERRTKPDDEPKS